MVEIALRMGADPNSQLPNKVNSTIWLLSMVPRRQLNYCWTPVVNIHARYCFGRTCLYNATEPSSPSIVSKILDHLPSTETFSYDIMKGGTTLFTYCTRSYTEQLRFGQCHIWPYNVTSGSWITHKLEDSWQTRRSRLMPHSYFARA